MLQYQEATFTQDRYPYCHLILEAKTQSEATDGGHQAHNHRKEIREVVVPHCDPRKAHIYDDSVHDNGN